MKLKVVTWMGNGEHRIDCENVDVCRLDLGDVPGVMMWFKPEGIHLAVTEVGTEFNIIGMEHDRMGTFMLLQLGKSNNEGQRPVISHKGEIVRYVQLTYYSALIT